MKNFIHIIQNLTQEVMYKNIKIDINIIKKNKKVIQKRQKNKKRVTENQESKKTKNYPSKNLSN